MASPMETLPGLSTTSEQASKRASKQAHTTDKQAER